MPPRSLALSLAVLTFVVAAIVAGVPSASTAVGAASETGPVSAVGAQSQLQTQSLERSETTMLVQMRRGGDARWRVTATFDVESETDATAFERVARDFESSNNPLGLNTFELAAENASAATGRSMEVTGVERNHTVENGTGTLSLSFTWTNFGQTSGDRLVVKDAFNTTTGSWLSSLSDDQTLVVVPPSGYGIASVPTGNSVAPVSITDGVVRWEGPQSFGTGGPWVVYSGDAPTPTPTATATPTATTTTTPGSGPTTTGVPPNRGVPAGLMIGLLALVGGVSAAVLVYIRGGDRTALGTLLPADSDDDAVDGTAEGSTGEQPASADSRSGGADTGDPAGAAAAGSAADGVDDDVDEELLSDEERVERLLEANGGRMKQASIVKETGWSNAKVSQLLSAMDEDGRIDKLRIGRENLISFPDEDVTDVDE